MAGAHRRCLWLELVIVCLFIPLLAAAQAKDSSLDARLLQAADRGDFNGVKAAIAAHADVNATDAEGYSALGLAGMRGRLYDIVPSYKIANIRLNIIKLLLEHGAVLPVVDRDGPNQTTGDQVPLNILVHSLYFRRYDVARLLLHHGAPLAGLNLWSVMRSYPSGQRPDRERRKLFEQALSASAPNARTNALLAAIESDDAAYFVRRLTETGANLNARDWNGFTPLTFAIVRKNRQVVKYLLDQGADPGIPVQMVKSAYLPVNVKYNGMTPLQIALESNDGPIIALLKKAGGAR